MKPSNSNGAHFFTALLANLWEFIGELPVLLLTGLTEEDDNADAHPAIIIKLAAPKSIQPYPSTSVLQNLRGNIGKSTARMAIVVSMYTHDLCIDKYAGLLRSVVLLFLGDIWSVLLLLVGIGINDASTSMPTNKTNGPIK